MHWTIGEIEWVRGPLVKLKGFRDIFYFSAPLRAEGFEAGKQIAFKFQICDGMPTAYAIRVRE